MPSDAASPPAAVAPGGRYPRYVLAVLTLVYVFNFLDRQILSILAERIKADLGLTDAQIGFLYGTAFAVFYALFGIPLGRLADVWDRRRHRAPAARFYVGMFTALLPVPFLVWMLLTGSTTVAYLLNAPLGILIGLALGPYTVGRLSVAVGSLRTAMLVVLVANALAVLCLFLASRHLVHDEATRLERARQAGETVGTSGLLS